MNRIASVLADWVYDKDNFPAVSYDAFKYAVEFAMEMAAGIFANFMIALYFGMVWESVIFLFVFWTLRSYAGGIHLDQFSHCFVFSSCITVATLGAVKYAYVPLGASRFMLTGGVIALLFTEPESDKNRKVDDEDETYFRRKLRQFLLIIVTIYLLFDFMDQRRYAFLIAFTTDIVYAMMILGKVKNRRRIRIIFALRKC